LQLVVDALVPEHFGGVGGEAIYIGQKVKLFENAIMLLWRFKYSLRH
jgi:hypothetical protein